MQTDTRLSICIPTFNNPPGISSMLQKLSTQAHDAGIVSQIEICVSDNSEDNSTKTVVAGLASRSNIKLHYSQNAHNIGYDRNVERVMRMANGDFCWLLSDNEDLSTSALQTICNTVTQHPEVGHILICPSDIRSESLKKYDSLSDAMMSLYPWIPGGLMSRNIFSRRHLPSDLTTYYGNDWLHLSVAIEIGDNPVICIAEQLATDPNDYCRWAADGQTFQTYTNLLKIMQDLPETFDPVLRQKTVTAMQNKLPREILSAKLYGLKANSATCHTLKDVLRGRSVLLAIALLALLVPTSFIRYGKRIKG